MANKSGYLQDDSGNNLLLMTKPENIVGFENKQIASIDDVKELTRDPSLTGWKKYRIITNNQVDFLWGKIINNVFYLNGMIRLNYGDTIYLVETNHKINVDDLPKNLIGVELQLNASTPTGKQGKEVLTVKGDGSLNYSWGDIPKEDNTIIYVPVNVAIPFYE